MPNVEAIEMDCYDNPVILDFSRCPKLTADSELRIINNLSQIQEQENTYKKLAKAKGLLIQNTHLEELTVRILDDDLKSIQNHLSISMGFNMVFLLIFIFYTLFKGYHFLSSYSVKVYKKLP
jgi:hypothetical protein